MKFSLKRKGGGGGKSGGGIKALLLKHGEKIGMAVVGVCVALFLYSAMGREKLPEDKQYDDLMTKVNASKQAIDGYTWEQAVAASAEAAEGESANVVFAQEMDGSAVAKVPYETYSPSGGGLDAAVVPPTVLRTDPVLLSVTDFEVIGWSALVPRIDEATRRKRMVEARKLEEKRRKEQEKIAEEAARAAGRGGGERGGGYGGPGPGAGYGRETGGYGYGQEGMVDPENPNRRMITTMVKPEGVALQGDERVEVTYGATILGKVPVEEQMKLYRDALENAKGGFMPERDRPRYLGYIVQRAEVTDSGAELKWETVKLRSGSGKPAWPVVSSVSLPDTLMDWPMEMEEVADTRYVHPLLTFPLPPIVGQNWGDRAKLADVPLQADFNPEEEMKKELESAEKPAEAKTEDDLFGGGAAAPGVVPGGEYGRSEGGYGGGMRYGEGGGGYGGGMRYGEGGGGYGGGMRYGEGGGGYGGVGRPGGEYGRGGGEGGGYGGGYGAYGGGEMGGGGMGVRRSFDNLEEPFNQKPFWMFRFFDMNVEPGKRYRYKVQLVLTDVNGYIPRQFLDGKVIARLPELPKTPNAKYKVPPLKTPWSAPSPVVSIPMAGELRVAKTTPATERQFNSEPSVRMLVKSFDLDEEEKPIQAAIEEEFRRGSVMNLTKDAETIMGPFIDKVDDFKFRTGATVLDIEGGEQLPGEMAAPSKVLVMDAGGRLSVRDELADIGDVEQHRAIFAPPEQNQMYPPGYGAEGGRRGN